MMMAQQLYEGIQLPDEEAPVGLITYMRTDSVRVADQALEEVREYVGRQFGADYVPAQPNKFKVKTNAQDAHEAIRPTSMVHHPEAVRAHLTPDQYYLYRLIWNRFVASQMTPATFDDTSVDITAADYLFRAKGSVPKFPGWLAVYGQGTTRGRGERTHGAANAAGCPDRPRRTRTPPVAFCRRCQKDRRWPCARFAPIRSSRSRPRASTKGRSSRRSKRTASAVRARTRRSSACCRRATT